MMPAFRCEETCANLQPTSLQKYDGKFGEMKLHKIEKSKLDFLIGKFWKFAKEVNQQIRISNFLAKKAGKTLLKAKLITKNLKPNVDQSGKKLYEPEVNQTNL